MKVWNGYGSEHSMNLVMIGHFKNAADAEETKEIIDKLSVELREKIDIGTNRENFGEEVMKILQAANCYILSPSELEHFLYDFRIEVDGDTLSLTTDETEVSAFFKLMIDKGAKIEMFSAHHHPYEERG